VLQADIYDLPFANGSFDFVYCFGVLQHTPDVRGAFHSLPPQLRPGGRLAVDVYPKLGLTSLLPRYWLRPLTTRVPAERLFDVVQRVAPMLLPMSDAVGRVPVLGRKLRHAIPVANYHGILDLTREQVREWAILDTFDWLAPRYDQPQTADTVRRWFTEAGLLDIWVGRMGFLVGRARMPRADEHTGGKT
jgi:SAM-dependent methyltransferase